MKDILASSLEAIKNYTTKDGKHLKYLVYSHEPVIRIVVNVPGRRGYILVIKPRRVDALKSAGKDFYGKPVDYVFHHIVATPSVDIVSAVKEILQDLFGRGE